ncbi:MAG: type II toxin-antitoxin system RelE/ParE family toxin [Ignavibacteria bacterium]|nr:type II toxin-antitoxin system RelE/ParE family toxin [Ignavibacteria bacterium]
MPEHKQLTVLWTYQALKNALSIKAYLEENFSVKEINKFFSLLSTFESTVTTFPKLYPQTNKKAKIRKAVLSREVSAFYRIIDDCVEVLAILDNRCDISKWL